MFWRKSFPMYRYGSREMEDIARFYSSIPGPRENKMISAEFVFSGEKLPVIWFRKPIRTDEGYIVASHAENDGEVLLVGIRDGGVSWGDALNSDYAAVGSKLSEVFNHIFFNYSDDEPGKGDNTAL